MIGDWVAPMLSIEIRAVAIMLFVLASHWMSLTVLLITSAACTVGSLGWPLWWWVHHRSPTGMAVILRGRSNGPVLLVTDLTVLATDIESSSRFTGRVRPSGPGGTLPGLVAIEAEGEQLILVFADGSKARLRQRSPTKGAAARVAAFAAPVLQRQRLDDARTAAAL